jgi:hypothetical protein
MAFCSRCGQETKDDAEFCIACGVYAADDSRVGAYSGAVSRPSYLAASGYGALRLDPYAPAVPYPCSTAGSDRRLQYEQITSGDYVLSQFERLGRSDRARPPLAPLPARVNPPDVDPVVSWSRQPRLTQPRLTQPRLTQPRLTQPRLTQPRLTQPRLTQRRPEQAVRQLGDQSLEPIGTTVPLGNGRWTAIATALAVLFVAATAAVALVVLHRPADQPPRAGGPSARATSASPAATRAPSPILRGLMTVDPGATTAPDEAAIVALLSRYFSAINRHDYSAYEQLFSPAQRAGLSAATFTAGYGTTRDSAERLHSIGVVGGGQADALVTFTSHQLAVDSPTDSSCTRWSIALYLVKQGHQYLLVAPPQGYLASYHACS